MRKVIYNPQFWYNPAASYACYYARDVIKGRWPEAESVIMKDHYYAYFIIKGRWYEAEPIIKGSKHQSDYERSFKCKL